MPRVFISYRHTDTGPFAGRLYDRLSARFGKHNVFKDVDDLVAGTEFWDAIVEWVQQTDVMLVLIGSNWRLDRLNNEDDFVRREIASGLAQPNCRVIPVLVNGANMPSATDLPENGRALAAHHALPLRDDPDFNRDVERLIDHIERGTTTKIGTSQPVAPSIVIAPETTSSPRIGSRWLIGAMIGLLFVVAVIVGITTLHNDNGSPSATTPTTDLRTTAPTEIDKTESTTVPGVLITAPYNGKEVPINSDVTIEAVATDSVGVTEIQLRVNDMTVATESSPTPGGDTEFRVSLTWHPSYAGQQTLEVVPYRGSVRGQSATITLNVR